MLNVIFVTQFVPSAIGHGGNHRAYQIQYDLHSFSGVGNVITLSLPLWQQYTLLNPMPNALKQFMIKQKQRMIYYTENPVRLFSKTSYLPHSLGGEAFSKHYKDILKKTPHPLVTLIEHTGFADIVDTNTRHDTPTLACIQNLESLDFGVVSLDKHTHMMARMVDFANEFRVLSQCAERLFISKVEAGLVGGLGLSSSYYPYLPVGEVRYRLEKIRVARTQTSPERGLFLMLGSAGHQSTREAFEWSIYQAKTCGLPPAVRVIIGGSETDKLLPKSMIVPGIELRGWLDQAELDQLIVSAQGILIPQFRGFGGLTRLPELAYTGVPVLVSEHATLAVNPPPGVKVVENRWEAWSKRLAELSQGDDGVSTTFDDYLAWEQNQPHTLAAALAKHAL